MFRRQTACNARNAIPNSQFVALLDGRLWLHRGLAFVVIRPALPPWTREQFSRQLHRLRQYGR